MGQHDTCNTATSTHVHDTIAFGSMLVFASVMPPLAPAAAEPGARSARQCPDAPEGIGANPAKTPATRSRRRLDS